MQVKDIKTNRPSRSAAARNVLFFGKTAFSGAANIQLAAANRLHDRSPLAKGNNKNNTIQLLEGKDLEKFIWSVEYIADRNGYSKEEKRHIMSLARSIGSMANTIGEAQQAIQPELDRIRRDQRIAWFMGELNSRGDDLTGFILDCLKNIGHNIPSITQLLLKPFLDQLGKAPAELENVVQKFVLMAVTNDVEAIVSPQLLIKLIDERNSKTLPLRILQRIELFVYSNLNHKKYTQMMLAEVHPEIIQLILDSGLDGISKLLRAAHTRQFLFSGGNNWDAAICLIQCPNDNESLVGCFKKYSWKKGKYLRYSEVEASDPLVLNYVSGFKNSSPKELFPMLENLLEVMENRPLDAPHMRPQAIAMDLCLQMLRKKDEHHDYHPFFMDKNSETGMSVQVLCLEEMPIPPNFNEWVTHVSSGLVNAPFLAFHKPPLQIRIFIRPGIHKDIANTSGTGSLITIHIDSYQVEEFSPGQMLGLLSHELGVHTLADSSMSKEQLGNEARDKAKPVTGDHEGVKFTVGENPALKRQQDDHVTIGRGLLGQPSALPRLEAYEKTMISLILAQKDPKNRWDTAAAYCIDIARILVTNDDPTEIMSSNFWKKYELASKIAETAANEWVRIQKKYGHEFPILFSIEISPGDMRLGLMKLAKLLWSKGL